MSSAKTKIKRAKGRPAKTQIEPCCLPGCGCASRIIVKKVRSRRHQPLFRFGLRSRI